MPGLPSPLLQLIRDDTGEEDSKVAAAAAREASSVACFLRLKRWPHPRLIRLPFLLHLLVSGTAAIVGDPLRRPGESAHCVLLEPSRRTELVRGSSGERGLDVLGVDASLHSDLEGEPAEADGATRPGVSVTPAGLVDGSNRIDRPNAPLPNDLLIFLASASSLAKLGEESNRPSLARWSARVADGEDVTTGDGDLLPSLLIVIAEEEDGQSMRVTEARSDRDTERRGL
jgi:hypothetical protein